MLASGCASVEQRPEQPQSSGLSFDPAPFGERPAIADESEIYSLTEQQESDFLAFFNDPSQQAISAHERIYAYLLETTSDFDFHSDTRTAARTLDEASGNCLSLAIVTTALANAVDVDTGYLLVDSTPIFERQGGIVSKTIHVRSILYDPAWESEKEGERETSRPGIQFDYFPDDTQRARLIGNLRENAYVAMYYSNMAGEALTAGDSDAAFWYLLESLRHDPDNAIALNTMAVVYRRTGNEQMAERIYRYGIDSLPENVSFLRNYHSLLKRQGRDEEAEAISRTIATLDDPNPFHWVNAGRSALSDGEFEEATRHLRRAIRIAPYLHEAHALMAVAHLQMGNPSRSERELRRAMDIAQRESTRSLYQAKLTVIGKKR